MEKVYLLATTLALGLTPLSTQAYPLSASQLVSSKLCNPTVLRPKALAKCRAKYLVNTGEVEGISHLVYTKLAPMTLGEELRAACEVISCTGG